MTDRTDRKGGDRLPADVLAWLRRSAGEVVAVVATVDADGTPRTALFGALAAPTARELRLSCRRSHATLANIRRSGRISLELAGPPDIAVSVSGQATVVGEVHALPDNVLVSIAVETVKDDRLPYTQVLSGIRYTMPDDIRHQLEQLSSELSSKPRTSPASPTS
jgi:hypothetical protein